MDVYQSMSVTMSSSSLYLIADGYWWLARAVTAMLMSLLHLLHVLSH